MDFHNLQFFFWRGEEGFEFYRMQIVCREKREFKVGGEGRGTFISNVVNDSERLHYATVDVHQALFKKYTNE